MGTAARTHRLPVVALTALGLLAGGALATPAAIAAPATAEQQRAARAGTEAPLTVTSSTVPAATTPQRMSNDIVWDPVWTLNRPAAWTLTLKDTVGRAFRTFTGTGSDIRPQWDGRVDDSWKDAPNGVFTWTLTGTADGAAPVELGTGKVAHTGGRAVRHDYGSRGGAPDGTGDIITTTASGTMRFAFGHAGTGNFSGSHTTTGWPKGILPVSIGARQNGGSCNDLLVRMPDGELRRYSSNCRLSKTPDFKPGDHHLSLGKRWNTHDVITSPGDLTRDGRADVVAREAKTGTLYLFATYRNGSGYLRKKVVLGTGFKGYKKIIGAGDLNGDRNGDLLLQDASNELWLMPGTGKGTLGPRTLVVRDWGASYNSVVGVGDLTGDGHADLVARDTAGRIWRHNGTGKGTFGTRVQLGTGWQVYDRLT
ncbi:VCBS repeat-containing protein [Streptomyces bambusae]|uniref:FG-GAP repeat domain-containing protein n=1 Tax=Streptomyces bambusae TaxID=1550616 RepID=UPI001CFE14AB|nr:VCBS repeat-containing protein [Streptomyces bambusae]MCB5163431.1 VCBS repeat-containing protein [Streptomyces bambusae]